jgi:SLT domain-containing protein
MMHVAAQKLWSADGRFGSNSAFPMNAQHDRSSPECVAKLFAALRTSNNRIQLKQVLNQYCATVLVLESKLLVLSVKIVLQHIPPASGRRPITL